VALFVWGPRAVYWKGFAMLRARLSILIISTLFTALFIQGCTSSRYASLGDTAENLPVKKKVRLACDSYVKTHYAKDKAFLDVKYNTSLCSAMSSAILSLVREGYIPHMDADQSGVDHISVGLGFGRKFSAAISKAGFTQRMPYIERTSETLTTDHIDSVFRQMNKTVFDPEYKDLINKVAYEKMDTVGGKFRLRLKEISTHGSSSIGLQNNELALFLMVSGQKIDESLDAETDKQAAIQGVGSAVLTGVLSGGRFFHSRWTNSYTHLFYTAVLMDENGSIVWTSNSGATSFDWTENAKALMGV
jgi:hypothetical protein